MRGGEGRENERGKERENNWQKCLSVLKTTLENVI